uniref:Uncharacterized protein n=1 Tax=Echinococcus canadensis TaxID=519352 RepID=A0A915EUJ1_9CEST
MVNAQHIERGNNLDSSGVCHEFQPRLLALSDHVPRFFLFLSYSKVLYVLILLFVPLLKADVFA